MLLPPLLLFLWVATCIAPAAGQYDYQWRRGRATFYGTDAWSIHKGNCGFGYIWQDEPLGWNVAAITDSASYAGLEFAGSCGRCYEVKCDPVVLKDGYGSQMDRTSVCYDPEASLTIRVVDSCPCNYPGNYYSNKRWCCGDMPHMDMSVWAFERLASTKWGVIGLQWRAVPCDYQPFKLAPPLPNPTPGQSPPPGAKDPLWHPTENLTPSNKWSQQQSSSMYQPFATAADILASSAAGTVASAAASASATASASSVAMPGTLSTQLQVRQESSVPQPQPPPPEPNQPGMQSNGWIFLGSLQNQWYDRSFNAKADWGAGQFGATGGIVACADLYWGGALSVGHDKGFFQGAKGIEFWVKTDGGRPDVSINIGSEQKSCLPQQLSSLGALESRNGWSRYSFNLGQFGSSYDRFSGCGGAGSWDATWLEFKNLVQGQQMICVDLMRLYS